MANRAEIAALLADELAVRFPLTSKQLRDRLRRQDAQADIDAIEAALKSVDTFVLAGENPRSWRLARPSDAGTDVCAACSQEKSSARFRTVNVDLPVCFDCEASGRRPRSRREAEEHPLDAAHFIGGRGPVQERDRRAGAAGYVGAHERLVYVTGGGSVYHLREDCEARRSGQAQAIDTGHRPHRLKLVPLRSVIDVRRPCARCAS